jgi:Tfp pilus assembly protein PilF
MLSLHAALLYQDKQMKDIKTIEKANIRKELITLKTYPYSDPSPIPEFGRLYPYNRFDGYTTKGADEAWEMIVLENAYIKLWVNPSVGGKIWGAIEKSTGKEFIYFNHTAKFRDVAMRGPWTSGGMEINMGIIGHTPSCSAPVDYKMVENEDGSVSCFIGATDWPSRTEWRVEIKLEKDAAYFSTKSWWHNNSCLPQSYYQWNNVGIKASGNLEYIYPGQQRLGHDGNPLNWPEDEEQRKISFYEQNNHGEYKSYHVIGAYTDFWGCYWHDDQFGMGHFAPYDEKPGKKIWIWGLSRYGMIWEDLLTDQDGQYTEVQSGRLFNQSVAASSKTPFKHRSFLPATTDSWEEHWFPVKNLGGLNYGTPQLSFYLSLKDEHQQIQLCANKPLNHQFRILHLKQEILNQTITLATMESCNFSLPYTVQQAELTVLLNDEIIYNGPEQHTPLKRPSKIDEDYNYDSVQASCIQAKEWERQRFFDRSIAQYKLCLENDPFFTDALNGLAGLYFKQMRFAEALVLLMKSLSVDTYDPEANYLYGLVNDRLQKTADAKDGFSIASQSVAYRNSALIELAKLLMREGQIEKAYSYVKKARQSDSANLQSIYLSIIINNLKGHKDKAMQFIQQLLLIDPINYLARFELQKVQRSTVEPLTNSELPYETYIELAAFYANLNLNQDAIIILNAAPEYPMIYLWKAHLYTTLDLDKLAHLALNHAAALKADFAFPHREEDIVVLRAAVDRHASWKFKYFLALAYIQNLQKTEALNLLDSCNVNPDFYPFYIVRANLREEMGAKDTLSDLKKAYQLAPEEWRTIINLSKYYANHSDWASALSITQKGYKLYPENYYLGLKLARCFMHTKKFEQGISLMSNMTVLPNEGASAGRNSWRDTQLRCAFNAITTKDLEKAIFHIQMARTWPENMGIGKPHHVDERLEDYMELICLPAEDKTTRQRLIQRIVDYRTHNTPIPYSSPDLISIVLMQGTGNIDTICKMLDEWHGQDPDALPLKWSLAFLSGNQQETDLLSEQKMMIKEVLPYEIPFEDRSFYFIKKLHKSGLLNKHTHLQAMN